MSETLKILSGAKELLVNRGWIQGNFASECGYCAIGAINRSVAGDTGPAFRALANAAGIGCSWAEIGAWNDADERTKADVLDAFDRAIASLEPTL